MENYPKIPCGIIAWHQEMERQRKEQEHQLPLYDQQPPPGYEEDADKQ